MYYLLLGALAIVAVLVTYFVTKKIAWNKGYHHGELSEREKHKFTDDATIKWDYNRMVVKGLNPLNGIEIRENATTINKGKEEIIPQFGINLKYNPNDEKPATRHFDVNIYCNYTNKVNENIKIFPDGSVSDGYHTFDELYEYRLHYNAAFINALVVLKMLLPGKYNDIKIAKSKKHNDGEPCYGGGWFIVVVDTPWGQFSNHYKLEHWDKFDCPIINKAWKFDGHTMNDTIDRLDKIATLISTSNKVNK